MKLLVLTQAIDKNDTTLGFFHRWIEEFSKRVERVTVVCLRSGEYALPQNVQVFSLGKGKKYFIQGKLRYIFNFYRYLWKVRGEYDVVFVHMNQEYMLLGGLLWKILGKKVFFWRNHKHGDFLTTIAVLFSDKVFYTSEHSFTAQFKKSEMMPAGIDTSIFQRNATVPRIKNSLLVFGRIAPVKKIEIAIDAVKALKDAGVNASLSIVGDVEQKDQGYLETLKDRAEILGVSHQVNFSKGVVFEDAPKVYQHNEIFLNFTPSGSFDKTIIEALACGAKVLVSNDSMKSMLPDDFVTNGDLEDITKKIQKLLLSDDSNNEYYQKSQDLVKNQDLHTLVDKIFLSMSK